MANHSSIVGGSTASRVINCPASVALVAKMPPQKSSKYADEGTLLHNIIAEVLDKGVTPESLLGTKYKAHTFTQALLDEKIKPALERFAEVDSNGEMEFMVETEVHFDKFLDGVFGSGDVLGKLPNRAVVLDWKFGAGVIVEAEENMQGMFYAAAAMRTPETKWIFEGVEEVEIIIIQPPMMKRWVTTPARIKEFEIELASAVKESAEDSATLKVGSHCKWCTAKPTCPKITGAVDRALMVQWKNIDPVMVGTYLRNADILEGWIADLRSLAHQMLEEDIAIKGYKLVAKRATRQWVSEDKMLLKMAELGLDLTELIEESIISPAKAEKVLKKHKLELPEELVVAVSSGSTLVEDSDPRPAVLQIGKQITAALSKLT